MAVPSLTIRPKPGEASTRTKNRLREHTFSTAGEVRNVSALGDREAMLLQCADTGCTWSGWLPTSEIICETSH